MSSKQAILDSLRLRKVAPTPLPEELPFQPVRYPSVLGQFSAAVEGVGGSVFSCPREDLLAVIQRLPVFTEAARIYARGVAGELSTESVASVTDPAIAATLDLVIADGRLGVAENGAIWIDDDAVQVRSTLFLTQHLLLCVNLDRIVDTMHEAYAEIDACRQDYGVFISGPSKTADIEQSLVLGAHGPRTLTVMLVKEWPAVQSTAE